jgi:hypothetical protein
MRPGGKGNRMIKGCLSIVLAALALTGCQSRPGGDQPIVVADRLYWAGPEGEKNQAYQLVGKFTSQSQLVRVLRLDTPIGEFAGRSWTLADILVRVDMNANGNVAEWMVSGPAPLTSAYVQNLRHLHQKKNVMYDFWASVIDVKPTAFFEGDEG